MGLSPVSDVGTEPAAAGREELPALRAAAFSSFLALREAAFFISRPTSEEPCFPGEAREAAETAAELSLVSAAAPSSSAPGHASLGPWGSAAFLAYRSSALAEPILARNRAATAFPARAPPEASATASATAAARSSAVRGMRGEGGGGGRGGREEDDGGEGGAAVALAVAVVFAVVVCFRAGDAALLAPPALEGEDLLLSGEEEDKEEKEAEPLTPPLRGGDREAPAAAAAAAAAAAGPELELELELELAPLHSCAAAAAPAPTRMSISANLDDGDEPSFLLPSALSPLSSEGGSTQKERGPEASETTMSLPPK